TPAPAPDPASTPAPAPAPTEPAIAWPDRPLLGLAPRGEPPAFDDASLRAHLEDCFAIVASWCELTAAFEERGEAPDALDAARARERAAAARLDRWRGTPTPMAVLAAEHELSPLGCAILLIAAAPHLWSELAAAYRGLAGE